MLTPQACITTISRSPDSRPSPISRPMSTAIGMVMPSADGTSVSMSRAIVPPSTPFAISSWASRMIGGISCRKVRTRRLSRTSGSASRRM